MSNRIVTQFAQSYTIGDIKMSTVAINNDEPVKQDVTYTKYDENFKNHIFVYIDPSRYTHYRVHSSDEFHSRITHTVPQSNNVKFKCDKGELRYNYSHFPANCGIGIYSAIMVASLPNQYQLTAIQYTEAKRELFIEFVHFIRRYTDKDMIIMTDRKGGTVEQLVEASDGEIKPIGESVQNQNSGRDIIMYQTTRLYDRTLTKKNMDIIEVAVVPKRYSNKDADDYFSSLESK